MIFRSLSDKRIKPEHYPIEIVVDINAEVKGDRGVAFATPTALKALIADKKVIIASDGNALQG